MKSDALQKEIGKRISELRSHAGLTQEQAAARAEIDYKRWQRLEQGAVNPTLKTLARIADALGVSFYELVQPAPVRYAKKKTAAR